VTERRDAELIAAAASDAGAFGELYRRHVSTVHGAIRALREAPRAASRSLRVVGAEQDALVHAVAQTGR
jgi:hypothetical protein